MGYQVLIDSENIPDDLVEIFHEQIESWYREATEMPDRLNLELYLSEDRIEWDATAVDNHHFDSYKDFLDELKEALNDSDEPDENLSLQFYAEGTIGDIETCEISDFYLCKSTEDDEESEIVPSENQVEMVKKMIIEFVANKRSEVLDSLDDNSSYSISVEDGNVTFSQEGFPEMSRDVLNYLVLDSLD
jgi:hypothetical protein